VSARALCLFGRREDQPETSGTVAPQIGSAQKIGRGRWPIMSATRILSHRPPSSREPLPMPIWGHTCVPRRDIVSPSRPASAHCRFGVDELLKSARLWHVNVAASPSAIHAARSQQRRTVLEPPPCSRFCSFFMFMQRDVVEIEQ
jgi:hypothetical protein